MDKKNLAIELSKLKGFTSVDASLEQYQTDSEIAGVVLWKAFMNGDVDGKVIADLGCGNGILGFGAYELGAKKVYFLDVDGKALEVAKENNGEGEFILGDVSEFDKKVDTVFMNPPFGVQNRKADKVFLEVAMKHSKKIYSFHKIESKGFLDAITKDFGWSVKEIMRFDFLLKKTMEFHSKSKYFVDVGCWILEK
tara:strand:- start:1589 stop:2173 length:585 start_codon:yes stop_codon:yes gene_type:complete